MAFVDAFPAGLRPYISHVKDVVSDGNCGFRVIGGLMGFGEDAWMQVRNDLLIELHSHVDLYIQLYGGIERIEELTHTLAYFEDCPGYDRWMTMPDMGHLIASHYNVVLFYLSQQQCLTFLPLRSVSVPSDSREHIAIGFINDNHFVEVFLLPGHPVPPISTSWHRYRLTCAQGCDNIYTSRIKRFREVVSSDVVSRETIFLDSD